ncbi:Pet127-domain-containing protein [Rickenella mellea]|uniref:Pet127-domain-containing protein n=1 Tax=Rickenella mellea TaxID=50990 RepID=A0A4Y7Q4W2_9AGAM|nr:Pet127-domain-containing protein [Rickenella mellea]
MRSSFRTAASRLNNFASTSQQINARQSHSDTLVKTLIERAFRRLRDSPQDEPGSVLNDNSRLAPPRAANAVSAALSQARSGSLNIIDKLQTLSEEAIQSEPTQDELRATNLENTRRETEDRGLERSQNNSRDNNDEGGRKPGKEHGKEVVDRGRKARKAKKMKKSKHSKGEVPRLIPRIAATEFPGDWNEADGFTTSWGSDLLAPQNEESSPLYPPEDRPITPQFSAASSVASTDVSPPAYTRRIEGLLVTPLEERPVLEDVEQLSESQDIPPLAHGLDRVLFNPGVHWVQDPRSRVYNFTPFLQSLPDVQDFAFERLGTYVTSSRDDDLLSLAEIHGKRFAGSTSSLTGIFSHIYFLLSEDRRVNISTLSKSFTNALRTFTPGQRMPVSLAFRHRNGMYAIDNHKPDDLAEKNILTWMGTMLEKFLTMSPEKFSTLLRSSPEVSHMKLDNRKEAYRYAKTNSFVMRSQLDCYDARLPGTGVFDIKTRAAVPIRLDGLNYKENSGYLIRTLLGSLESFEKEYYDLIRSAFLKYGFQARIGNMDGVFLAYHNTARLFGFQYVPLEEMDERIYGSKQAAERVFRKCVSLLETVSEEVVSCFPGKSVVCTVETLEGENVMRLWVRPEESADEESSPIVQLDVTAVSFMNESRVKGAQAVDRIDTPWTVHWTISHSALSNEDVHGNLREAKERLFRAHCLPSGYSVEDMTKIWANLNYGAEPHAKDDVPPEPDKTSATAAINGRSLFRKPDPMVDMLRRLAREGREDTDRWAELEKGKRKIVLGLPDYIDPVVDETPEPLSAPSYKDVLAVDVAVTSAPLDDIPDDMVLPSTEVEIIAELEKEDALLEELEAKPPKSDTDQSQLNNERDGTVAPGNSNDGSNINPS